MVNQGSPFFVDKARDIAELYLNHPDKAMVLKNQIRAFDRTQPLLPMGLG